MSASRLAATLFLAVASPAMATTFTVAPDGSGDLPTIQAAIDAAVDGDEIVLLEGTFTGDGNRDLLIDDEALTIGAASGAEVVLDAEGTPATPHRILTARGSSPVVIEGITVTGAVLPDDLGAILCEGSTDVELRSCRLVKNEALGAPVLLAYQAARIVLDACVISNNAATRGPSAALIGETSVVEVLGCRIEGNTAEDLTVLSPGAIQVFDSSIRIEGSTFVANVASTSSALVTQDCEGEVRNSSFVDNESFGAAVWLTDRKRRSLLVTGCWFEGNQGDEGGGGALRIVGRGDGIDVEHSVFLRNQAGRGGVLDTGDNAIVDVRSCTMVGNQASSGSVIHIEPGTIDDRVRVSDSIIAFNTGDDPFECNTGEIALSCVGTFGNDGTTTGCGPENAVFSADPEFCDWMAGELTLMATSPYLPGQHPEGAEECGLIGALGIGCGSTPVDHGSWSSLKARYRSDP